MSIVSERIQTAVIGAGVIGLAVSRALAKAGHEVLILEKEATIGSGISSRNSEVIHAGLYYPYRSLKRELCVAGRELLYDYCSRRDIEAKKCGKLIVASSQEQAENNLKELYLRGKQNGVDDLCLLGKEDVKGLEPNVICEGAILSPSTGIVDSHSLMMSLLAEAEENDAILSLNSTLKSAKVTEEGISLQVDDDVEIVCENVVNCAGLYAHQIARFIIPTFRGRQYFAKGNYYKLQGQKTPFKHLVYPMPEEGGLGVHATIDLAGYCRFGPDVEWYNEDTQSDQLDYAVDPSRADAFYDSVRIYWPDLKDGALVPDYAGIRPKLYHPNVNNIVANTDFFIEGPREHHIPGFVNLMGIESPGLTSCLSLAQKVVTILS